MARIQSAVRAGLCCHPGGRLGSRLRKNAEFRNRIRKSFYEHTGCEPEYLETGLRCLEIAVSSTANEDLLETHSKNFSAKRVFPRSGSATASRGLWAMDAFVRFPAASLAAKLAKILCDQAERMIFAKAIVLADRCAVHGHIARL